MLVMTFEKKVQPEKRVVVKLSQFTSPAVQAKPLKKVAKKTPPKKIKPPKPPKKMKKKPPQKKRKVVKKRVPKKVVPLKKAPSKEKIIEETEVTPEPQPPKEEPKEVVVTPSAPATLTPAIVKAIAQPTVSAEEAYVQKHLAEIMALLREHLYYPRMARKRHMEGKVVVSFILTTKGEVKEIKIESAKKKLLAKAAITTIERLRGKFPLPEETLYLHVPIMYRLK